MWYAKLLILGFFIVAQAKASYVIYHNDIPPTREISSIPLTNSGFIYSDDRGNSISYREVQSVPVIYYQFPWVWVQTTTFPSNAIVYQYVNGQPVYHCRVQKGSQFFYGQFIPHEGCFLFSNQIEQRPYSTFQILIR